MWPKVGVGGLILDGENRVLLVKRRFEPYSGRWSIPGGHVEFGERLEEALRRELREEVGLNVLNSRPYAVVELIVRGRERGVAFHYIIVDFLVTNYSGSLTVDVEELEGGAFFTIGEALKLDLSPSTRKLLEVLEREGSSSNVFHHITVVE